MNWTMWLILAVGVLGLYFAPKIMRKKADSIRVLSGVVAVLGILMLVGTIPLDDFVGNAFRGAQPVSVTPTPEVEQGLLNCPTDGDSSLSLNVYNMLNTSGSENYDITYYVLDSTGEIITSGSDTTSPSAVSVNCGQYYWIAGVASDADSGDNTQFKSTNVGTLENGKIKFLADRSNININAEMTQHGVLGFKLYDNTNARFAFDTGDAESATFETDGVTFRNGDNATAFVTGVGGYLDTVLKIQGTLVDTDAQDAYMLIAIEAPVTEYDEPQVKFDGIKLTDIKGSGLTSDEVKAFSGYEYVYKITAPIGDDIHDLSFYIKGTGSADPSTDVQIDFAPAGNYKATSSQIVKTGAVQDDSSKTAVFTVQDVTIDVS